MRVLLYDEIMKIIWKPYSLYDRSDLFHTVIRLVKLNVGKMYLLCFHNQYRYFNFFWLHQLFNHPYFHCDQVRHLHFAVIRSVISFRPFLQIDFCHANVPCFVSGILIVSHVEILQNLIDLKICSVVYF